MLNTLLNQKPAPVAVATQLPIPRATCSRRNGPYASEIIIYEDLLGGLYDADGNLIFDSDYLNRARVFVSDGVGQELQPTSSLTVSDVFFDRDSNGNIIPRSKGQQ